MLRLSLSMSGEGGEGGWCEDGADEVFSPDADYRPPPPAVIRSAMKRKRGRPPLRRSSTCMSFGIANPAHTLSRRYVLAKDGRWVSTTRRPVN